MKRHLTTIAILSVFVLIFTATSTGLTAKMKVGEEVIERFETPHPYGGTGLVWEQKFYSQDSAYISIHFDKFRLAKGDYVEVTSPSGDVVHRYEGKGKKIRARKKGKNRLSDFWASFIPGDTAIVRLYAKNKGRAYGFVIDKWVKGFDRGYVNAVMETLEAEAICTADDKDWAKCHQGTTMYEKSKAVCRLLINGSGACTGWLIGSEGHIMTNNHCIGSQSDASNTDYEFMAEGATCTTDCSGWFDCPGTVVASSGTMVQTDTSLDFTLVLLPTNVTSTYGYLQLRNAIPTIGERIYIPQHPGGKGKMLAVESDVDGPYAKVYSTDETPCMGGPGDIGYYADTEGGSSGSPVIAYTDNLVVALHHCANCPNRGVPIPPIITALGSNLPANAVSGGVTPPPDPDYEEMLDNTSVTFTSGGTTKFQEDTSTYYYGGDSAVSGTISHNQTSYLQTVIAPTSAKTVKFYWKVSSESGYDYLKFYIDGTLKDQISGTVDWEQKSYSVTSGSHTLKWEYYKDGSVSSGSDKGWVDKLEIVDGGTTPVGDLEEAVDAETLTFSTSGDGAWALDTVTTYYDGDSAKSPAISHNQSASFQTTVSGFTSVKFYWRVSSESNYDYLRFYIDGTLQDQISGVVGWEQKEYTVSTGSHTLSWTYYKDGSVSNNDDCGWVDKLELGTGTTTGPIAQALDISGYTFSLTGNADWAVTTSGAYSGGSCAVAPAALTDSQSAAMEVTVSGVTTVRFYWKVSSESSYDYLKFYIDGTLQDQISGTVGWTQKTYSVTSGSHTLKWEYAKDSSVSSGSDVGWVDLLELL